MTHRIGAMLLAVQEASLSVEIRICPSLFPTSAESLPGRHHFIYLAGRSFRCQFMARSSCVESARGPLGYIFQALK